MMMYNKGDIVKLKDGREVKIINLPTSFMANGSYEISYKSNKVWIRPDEIIYKIDKEWVDDINEYFEIIYDETGINIIPKELESIDIESDREDIKRVKLNLFGGRKHITINLHVGDTVINDKEKITIRPIKKKKNKIEKVIDVIKGEEDDI
jgi:hypothetical protein